VVKTSKVSFSGAIGRTCDEQLCGSNSWRRAEQTESQDAFTCEESVDQRTDRASAGT